MKKHIIIKDSVYKIGFSMMIKSAVDKYKISNRFAYYLTNKFPFIEKGILLEDTPHDN